MTALWIRGAALLGLLGVALGAFGAHGLRDRLSPAMMDVYRTGVLYHLLHAVAMLAVALAAERVRYATPVCALFTAGVLIFSGSLYALSVSGVRALGAITPIGGVCFLVGWLLLVVGGVRSPG